MGTGGQSGRMEGNEQKWKGEGCSLQDSEENGGAREQERDAPGVEHFEVMPTGQCSRKGAPRSEGSARGLPGQCVWGGLL